MFRPLLVAILSLGLLSAPAVASDAADPLGVRGLQASPPAPSVTGLPATRLTLAEAVGLALANNPRTAASWAAVEAQGAAVGQARAAYLPTVSVQAGLARDDVGSSSPVGSGVSNSASVSVAATYLLYDFGQREASERAALEQLAAANASLDGTVQALLLDTAQAYFALLGTDASLAATVTTETSAKASLDAATARYQAGAGTPADRLQAQTAHSQAVLNRIRAEGERRNARGSLATLLGLPPVTALALADEPPTLLNPHAAEAVETLIARAMDARPELRAADAQVRAAQAQATAVRAAGMPTVSVGVNLGVSTTPRFDDYATPNSVGLTVSVPLFTGYRTSYQIQQADALIRQRAAERASLAQSVALSVWKAYQDVVTQNQALAAARDLVASGTQSEQVALGRYRAGVGSILDVLSAQSAVASARQQEVLARYQLAMAKVTLVQSLGALDLHSFATAAR